MYEVYKNREIEIEKKSKAYRKISLSKQRLYTLFFKKLRANTGGDDKREHQRERSLRKKS